MKIITMDKVAKELHAAPLFTSSDVSRQTIISESKDLKMNIVNFGKGVRNKFHKHTGDQVLIITKGKGVVATEKEKKVVSVGDVVLFPAGEKHFHGATEDSEFSHLTIQRADGKTTQLEE